MRSLPIEVSTTKAQIGSRLRQARKVAGLTLEQLATTTGLNKGFISRIERDQTSPSVSTLVAICEVLHISIGDLFEATDAQLVRGPSAPIIQLGGIDAIERLLSPRNESAFQFITSHVEPGGNGGREKYSISAERELVYVVQGTVVIEFSDSMHTLEPGDAMTFPGRQPHQWRSETGAELLWVLVPAAWAGGV